MVYIEDRGLHSETVFKEKKKREREKLEEDKLLSD